MSAQLSRAAILAALKQGHTLRRDPGDGRIYLCPPQATSGPAVRADVFRRLRAEGWVSDASGAGPHSGRGQAYALSATGRAIVERTV